MKTPKEQRKARNEAFFTLTINHCEQTSVWHSKERHIELIKQAYDGCFRNDGAMRKSCPSWTGYKTNGVVDEKARDKCLVSAFCRLFRYHLGLEDAYLGTIMNATFHLRLLAPYYGLCEDFGLSVLDAEDVYGKQHPYLVSLINRQRASDLAKAEFSDDCDTFCQVATLIYTGKSSTNIEAWRKAIGV